MDLYEITETRRDKKIADTLCTFNAYIGKPEGYNYLETIRSDL